ncbi:DUF5794 domain-containing protein [Halorussus halobius]|uniref:DUF5794 domain-containing protein n=1 Tax=Halorussus halobius TaxID=1710537 RepID=UPI0010925FB1|nr:DUF5794 domain-containing protein [Halorussus halobius]
MSSSQHPVALRLERQVGGATKLLATVMCLPLVDGIFPALVLAGELDDPIGILQVGLLVFGGSATVAVILAEMDGTPREQARTVLAVGTGLVAIAAVEAAFAPTIASALDLVIFERFAALVMAAIAAKTASARIGEYLPGPSVIVGLGLVASLDPGGFELVLVPDYGLVLRAVAAAGSGVAFALAVALTAPYLREVVHIDRFRFGSAVALGLLPLSIVNLAPDNAPLAVLVVTGLLAYDPGPPDAAVESGGTDDAPAEPQTVATDGSGDDEDSGIDFPASEDEREPWL